jgi:hypothetical protein
VAPASFVQVEMARLEELREAALEDRIEAHMVLGRHAMNDAILRNDPRLDLNPPAAATDVEGDLTTRAQRSVA